MSSTSAAGSVQTVLKVPQSSEKQPRWHHSLDGITARALGSIPPLLLPLSLSHSWSVSTLGNSTPRGPDDPGSRPGGAGEAGRRSSGGKRPVFLCRVSVSSQLPLPRAPLWTETAPRRPSPSLRLQPIINRRGTKPPPPHHHHLTPPPLVVCFHRIILRPNYPEEQDSGATGRGGDCGATMGAGNIPFMNQEAG